MKKNNKTLQIAITSSSTIIGSLLCFGLIGYYLSRTYNNLLWLISFLILGGIVGLYDLYKQMNKWFIFSI